MAAMDKFLLWFYSSDRSGKPTQADWFDYRLEMARAF